MIFPFKKRKVVTPVLLKYINSKPNKSEETP